MYKWNKNQNGFDQAAMDEKRQELWGQMISNLKF